MPADDAAAIPRRNALVALAGAAAAACSKLAFVAANVPAAFGAYRRRLDVPYGSLTEQRLDIYMPQTPSPEPRPMVVFWYGGRWSGGDKGDYRFVGAALAELGIVAVLPNYRHYPTVKLAGFMHDAAQAAAWAAEHAADYGADPAKFLLMGHSAGAHMAALVTLDRRYFLSLEKPAPRIAGVVGLSGPYDFLPLTEADLEDMFGPPDRYGDSQPINFVRADAPPMLLIQGLADRSVWPKNSINLAAALRRVGVPVTLKLYPKLGHADTVAALSLPARGRAPTLEDVAAFVRPVARAAAVSPRRFF